tara:strand:+ start:10 stop:1266 length:1257 start_codon:yes stop_codon:yes gene_type:complete
MNLKSQLNKALQAQDKKKGKYLFPVKNLTFRNKDLIEGIKVILTKEVTMSKVTKKFEKEFSRKLSINYSLMANSGSSANLLVFQCLTNPYRKNSLKKGDEVLVPAVCWSTSFWPIIQSGLKPVFVDINSETLNIDIEDLKKKITKKTKALMLVHVLGNSTNMNQLMQIINKKKIILIEDTCESIGARYKKKFLGSFGDFSTFSFYYSHQISSMEGGMVCCKKKEDEDIIKSLRSHGWAKDLSNQNKIEKKFSKINKRFLFINSGYNLRPTDVQAAIGLSQFKSLSKFINIININRKKIITNLIKDKRWDNHVKFFNANKHVKPSWMGLPMLLHSRYSKNKNKIFNKLEKLGVENRPIISGNFLMQPALKKFKLSQKAKNFPKANIIHERGLFIGLSRENLSDDKIKKFVNIFFNSFKL